MDNWFWAKVQRKVSEGKDNLSTNSIITTVYLYAKKEEIQSTFCTKY